jgi:hypothetical protein
MSATRYKDVQASDRQNCFEDQVVSKKTEKAL